MGALRVLFISGSIGLGHIQRDLAIARVLRAEHPEMEVIWLAADPARRVLEHAEEAVLPDAARYGNDSQAAEAAARGMELNIMRYLLRAPGAWLQNVRVIRDVARREHFDLVIGDETYELSIALMVRRRLLPAPFVLLNDFVGLDAMTRNPLEHVGVEIMNFVWSRDRRLARGGDLLLFIGEWADIPDRPFGFLLPSRLAYARAYYHPVGYVLPFDPAAYADRTQVRARLGYGAEPLVIGAIGGTAIGKELLELWGQAYPLLVAQHPTLRLRLVTGPRLAPESIRVPTGVEVVGYLPALYEHLAACDLALVEGGGTVTLELTSLRRPFLYFPREGDFEQGLAVAGRLARQGAGIRMTYSRTTPALLAEAILANLGQEVSYPPIRTDGAQTAARLIAAKFLEPKTPLAASA